MANQRKVETIIAVGYEVEFSAMGDIMEKYHPGVKNVLGTEEKDKGNWKVKSGVYYSQECKGMDPAEKKQQIELDAWFKRRVGDMKTIPVKTIYVSRSSDIIVCELQIANERIYSFLLNRSNTSTSLQKKIINTLGSGSSDQTPQYTKHTLRNGYVLVQAYKHVAIQTQELIKENDGVKCQPYWTTLKTEQVTVYL